MPMIRAHGTRASRISRARAVDLASRVPESLGILARIAYKTIDGPGSRVARDVFRFGRSAPLGTLRRRTRYACSRGLQRVAWRGPAAEPPKLLGSSRLPFERSLQAELTARLPPGPTRVGAPDRLFLRGVRRPPLAPDLRPGLGSPSPAISSREGVPTRRWRSFAVGLHVTAKAIFAPARRTPRGCSHGVTGSTPIPNASRSRWV